MAYSHIVSHHSVLGASGGTTSSITTTGADRILVAVSYLTGSSISSVTDSKSNTYDLVGTATQGGGQAVSLYECKNATVGSGHTFTISGSSLYCSIAVDAFSGGLTSANYDVKASNNGGSLSSIQAGSITPTVNNELVYMAVGFGSSVTMSPGSGFTESNEENYVAAVNFGVQTSYKIQTTAGAENPTVTPSGTTNLCAIIASFKAYAADSTPPSDVTGLTGSAGSATQANLDWDNATDDTAVTDYRVYYNTSNSHTAESTVDVGSSTSAKNVTGLTPGTTYYFWVKAKDAAGNYSSAYSNSDTAVSVALPPRIDTTSPLNNATIDVFFSQTLAKTGQSGTWSKTSGTYPTGLSLDSSGVFSGTPTVLGTTSSLVFRFTQTTGGLYAEVTYSFTVAVADIEDLWTSSSIDNPFHYKANVGDWEAVTRSHEYEDGGKSFNELSATAPITWEIVFTGKTKAERDTFDAHFNQFKFSNPFDFLAKDETTYSVYYKDYKSSHEGNKSWVNTISVVFIKYP